jgi:hypothetical protein
MKRVIAVLVSLPLATTLSRSHREWQSFQPTAPIYVGEYLRGTPLYARHTRGLPNMPPGSEFLGEGGEFADAIVHEFAHVCRYAVGDGAFAG